ncbi:large conductance mechanosensitive channel protein MscL [Streptacidiphilus sp. ASG 303]|uniref:large conductance mechanosensitive channel protein MscL n=1 Tax=Streptacidiphilus sp. ASG 303 TaxID=2896847 RepID=UPI001E64004D|nr:large conductance mechanosensitive channel protein MscL [Streptacidiphilus sp. ASG 303]MCD0482357.1 large conductance mechanosensitive channel protein MscL [Streptacidiphilus sp. ASG 303]
MKGFRSFLLRGNVVDLAVGIVIGAAFTAVVNGFVTAFLTPLMGLATGTVGDYSKKYFTVAGTRFPFGAFLNALISFVLIAAVIYFLVVLPFAKLSDRFLPRKDIEAPKAECPKCLSSIPAAATRCAFCTAELGQRPFPEQAHTRV